MNLVPEKPDETPTLLFNPSKKDFTWPFADDNNVKHSYTLPSRQIVKFPKYIADHLAKHLASKLALEESPKVHYEERFKRHLKQIYVTI